MKKFYALSLFLLAALWVQAQMIPVTLAVDMNDVAEFDPAVDEMKVGGDFQGWSPDNTVMEDADGNGVYSATVDIEAGSTILFKFVINAWETNEFHPDTPGEPGDCTLDDGAGNINRNEEIPTGVDSYALPVYIYNTCNESSLAVNVVDRTSTIEGITVAPNPFSETTLVTISNPQNTVHNLTITNMTGQVVRQLNGLTENFVEIERGEMPAGMYFLSLQNALGEIATKRLMVQ